MKTPAKKVSAITCLGFLVGGLLGLALIFILVPALSAARRDAAQGLSEEVYGYVVAESNEDGEYYLLPRTASNIIDLGNCWWIFTLNGNRWMYHNDGYDQESLVLIPPTKEGNTE